MHYNAKKHVLIQNGCNEIAPILQRCLLSRENKRSKYEQITDINIVANLSKISILQYDMEYCALTTMYHIRYRKITTVCGPYRPSNAIAKYATGLVCTHVL